MIGMKKSISDSQDGKFLSLTDTLNLSLNVKIGYSQNSDPSAAKVVQFPKDLGFMIAGRVANNIGIFTEIGYESEDGEDPLFQLSTLVLPIVYELSEYTLETGSKANGQTLQAVAAASVQSYIVKNADREATAEGVGLYVANDLGYAVYSVYVPTVGTVSGITPASYASVAYTPQVGNWDVGMSGQLWWGTASRDDAKDVPLSVFLTYANAKKGSIDAATPNRTVF